VLAATGAATGEVLAEVFGLKKSPNVNLPGEAEGLATGLAATSGFALFRARFGLGDAAGDSAVEGDAACSADEAPLRLFCASDVFFAGEGDSFGAAD
jgi:hypothetical protein